MADNEILSVDDKLDLLPLLTKERTQRFELLLHLIPNLKPHIILCGQSGIGKTLLLDMLYDINSDVWQCCFVQGNVDLSFETIQAQLTKTMQRNKHASLDSALHDFQEQHKKIVLIIDDAGLLVSGLMTTLIEYAATQPAIKLIFSLTPEAKQAHRNTDKALNDCYILELPPLSKSQCAYFLRHLATKPRTYGSISIDEKLVEKIYADTQGIPAKIIQDFGKLSRKNENDYSKWIAGFIGVTVLAVGINQGVRYFKNDEPIEIEATPLPVEQKIEKSVEKTVVSTSVENTVSTQNNSPSEKSELDIVIPEFKLDIEKGVISAPTQHSIETTQPEKPVETASTVASEKTVEKPLEELKVEPDKTVEPVTEPAKSEPEKTVATPVVKIPEPIKPQIEPPKMVVPQIEEPEKPTTPEITFPKIQPPKGVEIQVLPEKNTFHDELIPAPEVKEIKKAEQKETIKAIEIKTEVKSAEKIQKLTEEKSKEITESEEKKVVKHEVIKKDLPKKVDSKPSKEKTIEKDKKVEKEKQAVVTSNTTGRYSLQLMTLSSEAAVENFKKKHVALGDNIHVVKSGTEEKPRFGLMYGGFSNADEATKAKQHLPAEFADALPRKSN